MARRAEAGWQVLPRGAGAGQQREDGGLPAPGLPAGGAGRDPAPVLEPRTCRVSPGAVLAFLAPGSAAPGAAESGGDGLRALRCPARRGAAGSAARPRHGCGAAAQRGPARLLGSLGQADASEERLIWLALLAKMLNSKSLFLHLGLLGMSSRSGISDCLFSKQACDLMGLVVG